MARARAPSRSRRRGRVLKDVPLFPLGTVLFPGGRLPLRIFEQRYMEMAKACLRNDGVFGVCLIVEGSEVGAPAVPADTGCLARIGAWDMPQLGMLHVTAVGTERFRIERRWTQPDGLQRAEVGLVGADADAPIQEDCARCVRILERVLAEQPQLFEAPVRLESSSWVGSRLAELLPLPNATKQALLELTDARLRLERINALLRAD